MSMRVLLLLILIVDSTMEPNFNSKLETDLKSVKDNGEPCNSNNKSCTWGVTNIIQKRSIDEVLKFDQKLVNLTSYPIFVAVKKGSTLGERVSRMLKEWKLNKQEMKTNSTASTIANVSRK